MVPSLFLFFLFMFNSDISPPLLLSPSSPLKKLEKSPNRRPILYSVIGKRKQERTATRKMGNNAATVSDGVSSDEESAAMFSRDSIDRTSFYLSLSFLCVCVWCVRVCVRALLKLKNIMERRPLEKRENSQRGDTRPKNIKKTTGTLYYNVSLYYDAPYVARALLPYAKLGKQKIENVFCDIQTTNYARTIAQGLS